MKLSLEHYVKQAKNGDRQALENLVAQVRDKIHGSALRMLNDPEDPEDAAQEILIKVITHLSDFREESAFGSWVYRVACNHLLRTRKQKSDRMQLTFDLLEKMKSEQNENAQVLRGSGPEKDFLVEEVRFSCMQGVLSCLEKEILYD